MATYSIKDIEKITGLKAHSLRMWESRYGLLVPNRTVTNRRYYTEDDLKFLLNVGVLLKNGIKISKIAQLSKKEIAAKVQDLSGFVMPVDDHLEGLVLAMMELESERFSEILDIYIDQHGFYKTLLEIIAPFLERMSLFWISNSIKPVQDKMVTQILLQKLMVACQAIKPVKSTTRKTVLLYLPVGESQLLILTMAKYFFKRKGYKVICLGVGNSLDDLKVVVDQEKKIDSIFTILSDSFISISPYEYLQELSSLFSNSQIFVTGFQTTTSGLQSSDRVHVLDGMEELIGILDFQASH